MKIIDEKGRLFGKVNIIDFLAILFFLGLLPMFYFGYKIFSKRPPQSVEITGPKFEIETYFKFIKLNPEIFQLISIGDKEYDSQGEIVGEIVELGENSHYRYELNIGQGKTIIKEDKSLKQIITKLKLIVILKDNMVYYKNNLLSINSPLQFRTNEYILTMIPFKIPEFKVYDERFIDLYVDLKDLDKETILFISEGDKEVDKDGNIIAEILSLGKIENNSFNFNVGNNNYIQGYDAQKKQITTKMRLKCKIDNENQIYFKGEMIKSGLPMEFNTDEYNIKGLIAQIFEVPILPVEGKWIHLQVKFTGVIPEVANIIKEGDMEREPTGKLVGKIRQVINNKQSEVLVISENDFVTLGHPFYKDILLWLDLLCIEKEGAFYFKNYPIKIGNTVTFATDLYNISGTIIGMEMK